MAEVKNICLEALERHCTSGETGRLDFLHEGVVCEIFMQERMLVHAHLSGLEGIPALFRLFDWGAAETTWNPGVVAEHPSLHLPLATGCVLYAEHLRDRASLEAQEKERIDHELAALDYGSMEEALKNYTVCLECDNPGVLPEGFRFSDAAKASYVIGNSDDCDVILRHPSIDPLHCGVILENGAVFIWDLGARTGVKLNGVNLAEGVLKVGDVMTLGALDLHVRFRLRRPNLRDRPKTAPVPLLTSTAKLPTRTVNIKGPITYDKVSKQLRDTGKAKPFLAKLGSLFGSKDKKK